MTGPFFEIPSPIFYLYLDAFYFIPTTFVPLNSSKYLPRGGELAFKMMVVIFDLWIFKKAERNGNGHNTLPSSPKNDCYFGEDGNVLCPED